MPQLLKNFLQGHRERIPAWLDRFTDGDPFPLQEFFSSRVVYYPGSGTDGHPVKLFGSTHSAHTFVYVDYGLNQARVEEELSSEFEGRNFRGYHTLSRLHLQEGDLCPGLWNAPYRYPSGNFAIAPPYGFLEILERSPTLGDDHGALRLAILFLGVDGIAAFDALFCQGNFRKDQLIVVLQDHGFGGNYDRFGRGGLMELAATRNMFDPVRPLWLLVAENTSAWSGFTQVRNVHCCIGGQHSHKRYLYVRERADL